MLFFSQEYTEELRRARKRVRELEELMGDKCPSEDDQVEGMPPRKRRKLNDE